MKLNKSDKIFLKELGSSLRRVRKSKGWTLEHTEEMGWSCWRHLQKIETGKNVTIITLKHIAQLYNISLLDIIPEDKL